MEKLNPVLLNLYGEAQECTMAEFQERSLELTKSLLHFDSAAVIGGSFSQTGEMKIHALHNHRQSLEKLHDRKNIATPDIALVKAYRQRGQIILEEAANIDRKQADLIQYCKKYDVAHTLVLISNDSKPTGVDLVALWRAKTKQSYTAQEVRLGNALLPHLFQARALNARLFRNAQNGPLPSSLPLLVSDQGAVQFVEERTIEALQAEWSEWTPPMMPPAFMAAIQKSRTGHYVGKTFLAQAVLRDRMFYIQLTPKASESTLTPTEQKVAELAASGLTYKAIAKQLGTAPSTVKNQLHSVYHKLEVSNKTSLAARLSAALK